MTPETNNIEREVKLDVELDYSVPDLRGLLDTRVLPAQDLLATYYDTADLRLWAAGITLRHRRGEEAHPERGLWTLKLPGSARPEWLERNELSWPGDIDDVPEEVRTIVKGLIRRHDLTPIVGLESRRRRMELHHRDGTPLGELDDDRVTVRGGAHDGLQFRQIEVELASSDAGFVDVIVQKLRSGGASAGRAGPKLARGLGISSSAAQPGVRLGRQSVLGDVVRHSLRWALDSLLEHDVTMRLRSNAPSPRDVHKSRVATRRLRSDLKTLRWVLDPVWTSHVRDDLKWLGAALGKLRDVDVLMEYVAAARHSSLADDEGAAILMTLLHRQREHAEVELAAVLGSERYLSLLDKLETAAESPPFLIASKARRKGISPDGLARKHLPSLTRDSWKKLEVSIEQSKRDPTDVNLHEVRIRTKQIRYAAELAEPVIGGPARSLAKAAQGVQELLGDHQDAVVTDQWLRDQIGRGGPLADFASGQLSADQMTRRHRARALWPKTRKRLRQPKLRRWTAS